MNFKISLCLLYPLYKIYKGKANNFIYEVL